MSIVVIGNVAERYRRFSICSQRMITLHGKLNGEDSQFFSLLIDYHLVESFLGYREAIAAGLQFKCCGVSIGKGNLTPLSIRNGLAIAIHIGDVKAAIGFQPSEDTQHVFVSTGLQTTCFDGEREL